MRSGAFSSTDNRRSARTGRRNGPGGPIYQVVVRGALVVLQQHDHGREQSQRQALHRVQQCQQTNVGPVAFQMRFGRRRPSGSSASPAGGGVDFTTTGRTPAIGGGGGKPVGPNLPLRSGATVERNENSERVARPFFSFQLRRVLRRGGEVIPGAGLWGRRPTTGVKQSVRTDGRECRKRTMSRTAVPIGPNVTLTVVGPTDDDAESADNCADYGAFDRH